MTPALSSEVMNWCASQMQLCQVKCKSLITSQQLKDSSYPAEGFLVVVDWNATDPSWVSPESEMSFAMVEHAIIHPASEDSSRVELVLDLCLVGTHASLFSSSKHKVRLYPLVSLTPFIYQWEALSKLHQNRLTRDLLSPRGGEYFGLRAGFNRLTAFSSSEEDCYILVSCWVFDTHTG